MKFYYFSDVDRKSRVKGDFQARFCGKAGVKFPRLTRLATIFFGDTSKVAYL